MAGATPAHERAAARHRPRDRLRAGQRLARGQPADQAGAARRHHGGRRLPVADPAPLRRPGRRPDARACRCTSCRARAGLTEAHASRARTRSCPARPAASSAWCAPALAAGMHRLIGFDMGGTSTDVSHFAGRRRVRARLRHPGGRRAAARADDEHPHGRRRRRLDHALRRRAPARRARVRRRRSRPGLLPARRPADRDRRQRDARADPAGSLPGGVRPRRRPAARRATRCAAVHRAGRRASRQATGRPTAPEAVAAGALQIAVANMANAIKSISVARGHDVTGYTLQCFGGAGGQHACAVADALGMAHGAHPPAGRGAVGLRHGPGRPDRDARGLGRAAAGRGRAGAGDAAAGRAGARPRWPRCVAQGVPAARDAPVPRAACCATRAPTPRWPWRRGAAGGAACRLRGRLPPALRLPACRAARW